MNWTLEQIADRNRMAEELSAQYGELPRNPVKAHGRTRPAPGMNKTEALYAQWLELQAKAGAITWFQFEGITLKLAPDTRYTPDFAVMYKDGEFQCHEIKGRGKNGKARFEDDARVKIAVAAAMFPLRFIMVWPGANGEWEHKDF